MRAGQVQAQAKINHLLHVLRRDDATGYHDLSTIFQRIDLADDVIVRTDVSGRTLDVTGPRVPAGGLGAVEKNLAYRAAVEFSRRAGWPDGFAIQLTKNIPVGAGLGGGSADAGGVLRILNALAPERLPDGALMDVASALGSDVPFLTTEWYKAIGVRRGDDLTNGSLPPIGPPVFVVIVVPGFAISTADAYRWLDETRPPGYLRPLEDLDVDTSANDFEPVVEARYPELRLIRERLLAKGAFRARLAGSGSCVFGLFREIPPSDAELGLEHQMIRTQLSTRVVQVQVLE
ncbi:MAG: 4-(cytidine 5'-diphospho)-2-C-methyl-D-erythritol kinase [Gemmatimonadaceae bacterium]